MSYGDLEIITREINEPEEERKLFIGGLKSTTTEKHLYETFLKYGHLVDVIVIREADFKPRGFGFVTFSKSAMLQDVVAACPKMRIMVDGKMVEIKRITQKEKPRKKVAPDPSLAELDTCKIFVGGIPETTTDKDLRDFFSSFGIVESIMLPAKDKDGKSRGFAFVTFASIDGVDAAVDIKFHYLNGKKVEVKRAIAKDKIKKAPPEETEPYQQSAWQQGRGSFRERGDGGPGGSRGGGPGFGGPPGPPMAFGPEGPMGMGVDGPFEGFDPLRFGFDGPMGMGPDVPFPMGPGELRGMGPGRMTPGPDRSMGRVPDMPPRMGPDMPSYGRGWQGSGLPSERGGPTMDKWEAQMFDSMPPGFRDVPSNLPSMDRPGGSKEADFGESKMKEYFKAMYAWKLKWYQMMKAWSASRDSASEGGSSSSGPPRESYPTGGQRGGYGGSGGGSGGGSEDMRGRATSRDSYRNLGSNYSQNPSSYGPMKKKDNSYSSAGRASYGPGTPGPYGPGPSAPYGPRTPVPYGPGPPAPYGSGTPAPPGL